MKQKTKTIFKQSKIINIGNSCAFDALTFWINLIPVEQGIKILKLMEPNLKKAIVELSRQLNYNSSNDYYLQLRLHQINNYIKQYYNVASYDLLSVDDMLFDNEKLLESGYITETFDDFKDISIQIVNLNGVHYAIKILVNDHKNNITNIIYIDDSHYCETVGILNEEVVLVCNVNIRELPKLCNKIENMCI